MTYSKAVDDSEIEKKYVKMDILGQKKNVPTLHFFLNITSKAPLHRRLRKVAQWLSGSILLFHAKGMEFKPWAGKVDSAFHPFNGTINECQACLGAKYWRVSRWTDHLTEKSTHAPQCSMSRKLRRPQ
ncbi:hypothetical protein TNCV_4819051 [Trichonephila clavipes]|nr:hypothetical protein TNCV_4819051 [Trichonephila clavipes]